MREIILSAPAQPMPDEVEIDRPDEPDDTDPPRTQILTEARSRTGALDLTALLRYVQGFA